MGDRDRLSSRLRWGKRRRLSSPRTAATSSIASAWMFSHSLDGFRMPLVENSSMGGLGAVERALPTRTEPAVPRAAPTSSGVQSESVNPSAESGSGYEPLVIPDLVGHRQTRKGFFGRWSVRLDAQYV